LTIPGISRAEKEEFEKKLAEKKDAKKKKKVQRVDCERCKLSLRDKFVLKRHVSSMF
jgi:hypothetical protein